MKTDQTVDDYIANAAPEVRARLESIRKIIRDLAPDAEEKIRYGIPGYYTPKPLIYFGAFKKHIALYAVASRRVAQTFEKELSGYKTAKGTIQFPLDEPLPLELIRRIVAERVAEARAENS